MQRYHRHRHRLLWVILGPLALAVLIYALMNRPSWPTMEALPGESTPSISR